MEEFDDDSFYQDMIKRMRVERDRSRTAAETRWDLLERVADGWHPVLIPIVDADLAGRIIKWVESNAKHGTRLHMEGPELDSKNKGIAVFEDKADAALFKTIWC